MPFGSVIASPRQLAMMKQALDDYCDANGIPAGSGEYENVAGRIIFLFSSGFTRSGQMNSALLADLVSVGRGGRENHG